MHCFLLKSCKSLGSLSIALMRISHVALPCVFSCSQVSNILLQHSTQSLPWSCCMILSKHWSMLSCLPSCIQCGAYLVITWFSRSFICGLSFPNVQNRYSKLLYRFYSNMQLPGWVLRLYMNTSYMAIQLLGVTTPITNIHIFIYLAMYIIIYIYIYII